MEVKGNFEVALTELLDRLKRVEEMSIPGLSKFARDVLFYWDFDRGNDWFTSTKLIESKQNESTK